MMISHKNLSTYGALVTWGATGFMSQPSFASLVVHIVIVPIFLFGTIWLAHHEGQTGGN